MTAPLPILMAALIAQASAAASQPPANPLFRELIDQGFRVGEAAIKLVEPTLPDGTGAEGAMAAIKAIAGDERATRELLRDSVTAPFILRSRDVKAGDATVRISDLWFAVHARLDAVNPLETARKTDGQAIEAGNMRVESKLLTEIDLQRARFAIRPAEPGRSEWFSHQSGRLLDRIAFEATNRTMTTRTADSLVIATRTEPQFDRDEVAPNRWSTIARRGSEESKGPTQPYAGGASYAKITRLPGEPDILFVEAHFAFVEPQAWFQGSPILRSKIGVIAQDQIRRLRREIREKAAP